MQEGNLVSFLCIIKTHNNATIEIFVAEIIKITEKAILIEWDDSTYAFMRTCQSWIPKSKLILMDTRLITWKKHRHKLFYVALPEWVKLEIETTYEWNHHYPEGYYEDYDPSDIFSERNNRSSSPLSVEDSFLKGYYDEMQEIDDDREEAFLIKEYNKNIKPWIKLWDKTLVCRRCYHRMKVECNKYKCPNHPKNPNRDNFCDKVGLGPKKIKK